MTDSTIVTPVATDVRVAAYIAQHDCVGVVAVAADALTVCSSHTRWLASGRRVLGFTVQTVPNTRDAARDWLGY